jgi:tetratricopeptide (TPR) repeat protein
MSSNLQSLNAIKPLGSEAVEEDGVRKEYRDGMKFFEQKEYGQAALALHNALLGFEQRQDDNGIANASNQLGHVCLARDDFDNALRHYRRSLEICEKANDRMSVIAVLKKILVTQRGLKRYDEALASAFSLLDVYRDNRDPQGTVDTLEVIADVYLDAGQPEKAADTFKTIASIHKNFSHLSTAEKYLEKASGLVTSGK